MIEKHEIQEKSATSESVIDALVEIHRSVNEIGSAGKKVDSNEESNDESVHKLPAGCEMIHSLIATPRRYCALIGNYVRTYGNKRASIKQRIQYLAVRLVFCDPLS